MRLVKTLIALQVAALALLSVPAGAAPPLPRGGEIKVNTNTVAWHYNPSVAVFPDGGFVVVFTAGPREDQPGRRVIHARLFDSQGRPTSGQFRLIDRVEGSQLVEQVVADRDGSFLVAWTENTRPSAPRRVFVRRFNRDGTPRGKRILVHGPSGLDRSGAFIGIGPNGRFGVAWEARVRPLSEARYTNAMARIFTAQGEPLTDEILVLEGRSGIDDTNRVFPRGAALGSDGTLNVLVQAYEDVTSLSTNIVRITADGSVSETINLEPGTYCCLADYLGASLVMSRDGGMMAVWSNYRIMAQRLTPAGEEGNSFSVSQKVGGLQSGPVIAQNADGSFLAVWSDWERDGDRAGIFARAFTANGEPLSRDFRINKTIEDNQRKPAIAATRQGPTVVVWEQVTWDQRADIFARILR